MIAKVLAYCLASLSIFVLSSQLINHHTEHVDCIELNHFCDSRGKLVFEQVIFWDRVPETGKFHVRAWCMTDDRETSNRRPVKNEQTGLYQVEWFDTDQRLRRKITSRIYRESWTQVDPEREDQSVHSERTRIAFAHKMKMEPPE